MARHTELDELPRVATWINDGYGNGHPTPDGASAQARHPSVGKPEEYRERAVQSHEILSHDLGSIPGIKVPLFRPPYPTSVTASPAPQ
jgi:hypothetical protein